MSSHTPPRHYLQFSDFSREEYDYLLARARWMKARTKRFEPHRPFAGRTLVMVFEKASTRTRLSFEIGIQQLGGNAVCLTTQDSQFGRGEPVEDAARVISRMADVVMIRTFEQSIVERFASHSRVPLINGLTNEYHPCQVLADVLTFVEQRGAIQGKTVTWVGDANNMCNTWVQAARVLDFQLHIASPEGYGVAQDKLDAAERAHCQFFTDPREACRDSHLITTDVWTSMGFEAENEARKAAFANWCVDAEMMAIAQPDVLFMHCLPAHRGEEVAAEVIDGPQSAVWSEAENRLHAQKALMEYVVFGKL